MVGLWPFHALLAVGGDAIQTKAFEAARTDPKVAGLVVVAMEMVIGDNGRVWSGLTETVRRLGLETAVSANARVAEATAARQRRGSPVGLAGLLGVRPGRASGCEMTRARVGFRPCPDRDGARRSPGLRGRG